MKKFLNAKEITLKSYKDTNDEKGTDLPIAEGEEELNFHLDMRGNHVIDLELVGDEKVTIDIDENTRTINLTSIGYINKDKVGNIKIKRQKEKVKRKN